MGWRRCNVILKVWLLAWLVCLWGMNACGQAQTAGRDKTTVGRMEIELDQIRFTAPADLDDETNYSFKNPKEKELLMVTYGRIRPSTPSLQAVIADRLSGVKAAFGEAIQAEPVSATNLGGRDALQTSFLYHEGPTAIRQWWVFAMLDEGSYGQIVYERPAAGAENARIFEHIKESVAETATDRASSVAAIGFVRRGAGRLAVDVPRTLDPPGVYLFVSQDRHARITLRTSGPHTPSQPLPPVSEEISADVQAGAEVSDRKESRLDMENGISTAVRYLLTTKGLEGPEQKVVLRERLVMRDGTTVACTGTLQPPSDFPLDRNVAAILRSIGPR